jgi:hypothetical protein
MTFRPKLLVSFMRVLQSKHFPGKCFVNPLPNQK